MVCTYLSTQYLTCNWPTRSLRIHKTDKASIFYTYQLPFTFPMHIHTHNNQRPLINSPMFINYRKERGRDIISIHFICLHFNVFLCISIPQPPPFENESTNDDDDDLTDSSIQSEAIFSYHKSRRA